MVLKRVATGVKPLSLGRHTPVAILLSYYGIERLSRHILRARLDGAYWVFNDCVTPLTLRVYGCYKKLFSFSLLLRVRHAFLRTVQKRLRILKPFQPFGRPTLRVWQFGF